MAKVGFPSYDEKLAVARHSGRYIFSHFSVLLDFYLVMWSHGAKKMNELVELCQGQQGEL